MESELGQTSHLLYSSSESFVPVTLPHLTSPYKGEEQDGYAFLVPLLCKEG